MVAGLLALVVAAVFALVLILAFPEILGQLLQIVGGTIILLLGLLLFSLLIIAIFKIDVKPIFRNIGVMLAGNRVVDFFDIFPPHERVELVDYEDTDGDGEKEWIVFYQFDLTDGRSPYGGTVYDFDRGEPPVVFPYRLVPPDRDYLSEGVVRLELADIVKVGEGQTIPELMVYGKLVSEVEEVGTTDTDLNIFRQIPNSFPWEFPRDEPRRYQVIGSFRGDGGVSFDPNNNTVTVIDRKDFDRSALSIQSVYALDENRGTYMSVANPAQLKPPISSVVSFAYGMPPDILDTPYPEKLVLGFYEMLAEKDPEVPPRDFLTGQALIEFDNNNLGYFGFGNATGNVKDVNKVTVTQLSYAPETGLINPSVTVLGTEPRLQTTSVSFEGQVGTTGTSTSAPVVWVTTVINGQWKIDYRLQ